MRSPRQLTEVEDTQLYYAKKFYFDSGGNTEQLIALIGRVEVPLTKGTRKFISAVLSGQIKAEKDLKPNYFRDFSIYQTILAYKYHGIQLTYDRKPTTKADLDKKGAYQKVSEIFGITEVNAREIYKRMRKLFKEKLEDYL